MRTRPAFIVASIVGAVAITSTIVAACPPEGSDYKYKPSPTHPGALAHLATLAVEGDEALTAVAIGKLRAAGQPGLDALFETFPGIAVGAILHMLPTDSTSSRWIKAVDAVARQRDAAFSRLYWHTDLDAAIAAATEANRPILSLRLLGNLDEDRSCANSRYFRTVLYADPAVADYLRDSDVLHWQSVRPVPHITIDMGDGRKIERTITGNSVHYVLDARGNLIDALPGLWAADAFLDVLRDSCAFVHQLGSPSIEDGVRFVSVEFGGLKQHLPLEPLHDSTRAVTWRARTIANLIDSGVVAMRRNPPRPGEGSEHVWHTNAPAFDLSKSLGEGRMRDAAGGGGRGGGAGLFGSPNDATRRPTLDFEVLSAAFPAMLSAPSRALMWQKRFGSMADAADAEQQSLMAGMIATFERSLVADSVLARFDARPRALKWIAEAADPIDLDAFNARVYAELFLSPLDDPWMGLVPPDAYAALDGEGLEDSR